MATTANTVDRMMSRIFTVRYSGVVLLMGSLWCACTVCPAMADDNAIGRIVSVLGTGTLIRRETPTPLRINATLQAGDLVITDAHTRIQLELTGQSYVIAGANTELLLSHYLWSWGVPSDLRVQLHHGSIRVVSEGAVTLVSQQGAVLFFAAAAPGVMHDVLCQFVDGIKQVVLLSDDDAGDAITTAARQSVAWPEGMSPAALPLP